MEAIYSSYDFDDSRDRIDEILAGEDANYSEHKGIPARNELTFTNGFYVDVTVMFIDIRGSKELASKHKRPVLAKIYRAYISEVVAVLKGEPKINEIYIEGDGVWAVFNTTTKEDVQSVINTGGEVCSLIDVLNIKLKKRSYSEIKIGIGIEDGESLYIKAGYKGSSINEVVWIGKSVGAAAELSGYGNKSWADGETMISSRVYGMLTDSQKELFFWSIGRSCYTGTYHNLYMNQWVKANE
ncbi:adenylate/guanylate cyclase domain-containing protein [Massilia sp. DJPM01]|uniref:adenylate/guanylate cyclase domain-containing protein n=1 Tax=Massilia sp. DJPM01 TaxID=3024404 RepID=UPI00259EED5C|nr:adenylate/guanylate cyclase domain-containing protein [Massilia sp. DJPM01]MDM5181181.1 adenylate/guanylate cyclase domain-containing protein [Massilia sp. DJPM01]